MEEDVPEGDGDREVPDEYAMSEGGRPDRIKRRNRITGAVLLVLIAVIVGITVWSRSTGEPQGYNEVGEPAEGLGEKRVEPAPHSPGRDR